jgi:predicted patatin/cPLA2 family phospholipase
MKGMIFPPAGTKWDSWDDEDPTQRAILIRAIRETPKLLNDAIAKNKSWHDVIDYIMRKHETWRAELNDRERLAQRDREEDEPTHKQAVQTIASILERIDHAR